jgi:predicted HicB family RNase H-like nuclease
MSKKNDTRNLASRYVKMVEWSDEDHCYIGRCPELFHGGTHGGDEVKVYATLSAMVEEAIEDRLKEGRKLPAPVMPQKYSGKFLLRLGSELHKALSVRAFREGKSINQVCVEALSTRV